VKPWKGTEVTIWVNYSNKRQSKWSNIIQRHEDAWKASKGQKSNNQTIQTDALSSSSATARLRLHFGYVQKPHKIEWHQLRKLYQINNGLNLDQNECTNTYHTNTSQIYSHSLILETCSWPWWWTFYYLQKIFPQFSSIKTPCSRVNAMSEEFLGNGTSVSNNMCLI